MSVLDQLKTLFRSLANFAALAIGSAAGVAQLAGLEDPWSNRVLTGVGIVCLLFLVIRWWFLFYDKKIERLQAELGERQSKLDETTAEIERHRAQLATLQVGHRSYLDGIEHVVDNSGSVFRERLTITVLVGADDDGDRIVERHETEPRMRMTQRSFRPILPYRAASRLVSLEDIGLRTRVEGNACQVTPLPLIKDNILRVWLVFRPGLNSPAVWEVEYESKGLWRPLRETGTDYLTWSDRPPVDNGGTSVLDELVVKFIFPRGDTVPAVSPRYAHGSVEEPVPIEGTGGWLVTFRDRRPAGRQYIWDVNRNAPSRAG